MLKKKNRTYCKAWQAWERGARKKNGECPQRSQQRGMKTDWKEEAKEEPNLQVEVFAKTGVWWWFQDGSSQEPGFQAAPRAGSAWASHRGLCQWCLPTHSTSTRCQLLQDSTPFPSLLHSIFKLGHLIHRKIYMWHSCELWCKRLANLWLSPTGELDITSKYFGTFAFLQNPCPPSRSNPS